ncbi:PAS domain S-box protein [Halobacteriales archaeon Cl-PHB]
MAESIRVLHVEDDVGFADLTADVLGGDDDLHVDTELHPGEALERLADSDYDCIVSDHDMPGMNGIEFLEAVRADDPDVPFILFTGKGSEQVASRAISAGVSDYLQKGGGTDRFEILANRIRNAVERTRAQRDLQERTAHLEQAQSVADLGSWEKDILADEIDWSDAVYDIFDIDEEDRTDLDHAAFLDYVHPDDRERVDAAWQAALDGADYDVEHRIVTDAGETRWVRERAEIAFEEDGTPTTALGIVQDITDRKAREDRLQQTAGRLAAIFEQSPDMINYHDSEGNILDPNPRLCERTGYSRAELTGMKVWDFDHDLDPDEARRIWEHTRPGESHKLTSSYECADGSTVPVEVHIRRLDQGNTDHFVVISREIGDREPTADGG